MTLETDIATLRKLQFFAGFNDEQLRMLAFGSNKMNFPANTELFHHNQTADGGYVILQGEISISTPTSTGVPREEKLGPGSLIGEISLITRNRRTGTATITEPCEILKIRRDVMFRILHEYPELAAQIHEKISTSVVALGHELEKVKNRYPVEDA